MREMKLPFILPVTVCRILKICLYCSVDNFSKVNIFIDFSFEKKLLVSTMFTMEQKIWIVKEGVKLVIQVKIKKEFVRRFISNPYDGKKLHEHQVGRVVANSKAIRSVKREKFKGRKKSVTTDVN